MFRTIYAGKRCSLCRQGKKGPFAILFDGGHRYGPYTWREALDMYRRQNAEA